MNSRPSFTEKGSMTTIASLYKTLKEEVESISQDSEYSMDDVTEEVCVIFDHVDDMRRFLGAIEDKSRGARIAIERDGIEIFGGSIRFGWRFMVEVNEDDEHQPVTHTTVWCPARDLPDVVERLQQDLNNRDQRETEDG
jgi:hypothetical protein